MKYLIPFILFFIIAACDKQTPQEKAKKLIKDHLFATLHDFKSYEEVSFDKLDSSFTSIQDDSLYKIYGDVVDELLKTSKRANDNAEIYAGLSYYNHLAKRYINESRTATDSGMIIIEKMKNLEANFRPAFNGWKMKHSYRAKNLSGNTSISHNLYYFDKDLTKILHNMDIGAPDDHD